MQVSLARRVRELEHRWREMFRRGLMDDLADVRAAGEEDQVSVLIEQRGCLGDRALDHGNGLQMASGRPHSEGVRRSTPTRLVDTRLSVAGSWNRSSR